MLHIALDHIADDRHRCRSRHFANQSHHVGAPPIVDHTEAGRQGQYQNGNGRQVRPSRSGCAGQFAHLLGAQNNRCHIRSAEILHGDAVHYVAWMCF